MLHTIIQIYKKYFKTTVFSLFLALNLAINAGLWGNALISDSKTKYSHLKETLLSNESKDKEVPVKPIGPDKEPDLWNRFSELIFGKKIKLEDLKIKNLNIYEKLDLTLTHFSPFEPDFQVMDSYVLKELSLATGAGSNKQEHLVNAINRCQTTFGYIALAQEISNPTDNIDLLEKKQALCKKLLDHDKIAARFDKYLLDIKNGEEPFLRIFDKKNLFHHKVKEYSIEKYLENNPVLKPIAKELDCSPQVLNGWKKAIIYNKVSGLLNLPFVGQVTSLASMTALAQTVLGSEANASDSLKPLARLAHEGAKIFEFKNHWNHFKAADTKFKLQVGIALILPLIVYGTIYKVQMDNIFSGVNFDNYLINKVKLEVVNIKALIKAIKTINKFIEIPENKPYFTHIQGIESLSQLCNNPESISPKLKKLFDIILSDKQITDGKALAAYFLIDEVKELIMPALQVIGHIDVALSNTKLIKEFENKRVKFSFVKFTKTDKPYLKIKNGWTPLVNPDYVVTTNFEINGPNKVKNMMLTGPGGCGKSTSMKELCTDIVLAQTLGITSADSMEISPYSKICTAIGVEEDLSRNKSKFMAQQERMKQIEAIMDNNINKFVFIAVDECYNGTTEILGAKLLNQFAIKAGKSEHTTSIISTHFRIGGDVKNFSNYQVELLEPVLGKFKRTFRLLEGVCDWWLHDPEKAARFASWLHGMEVAPS